MIRGVHESTIRRYMRLFETEPALREPMIRSCTSLAVTVSSSIGAAVDRCAPFICVTIFTLVEFRPPFIRFERGELVHALQRAIHIGTVPVRRGRDQAPIRFRSTVMRREFCELPLSW
jgi:hypothetical protein